MRLLIISGKGGTGKTTIAAAFAQLASCPLVIDCDVEASNLQILLQAQEQKRYPFSGAKVAAARRPDQCVQCGICTDTCRFNAIVDGQVDVLRCEGCGACVFACPQDVLTLVAQQTGEIVLAGTDWGLLSRAEMEPGAEGSGKLVTEIRRNGQQAAPEASLTLLDGPPGVGCPVIASITGCNLALVVAEPTSSGLSDARRILALLQQFQVEACLCINRWDISPDLAAELQQLCREEDVALVGQIPYDPAVNTAQKQGQSILDYPQSPAAVAIEQLWENVNKKIREETEDEDSSTS